MPAPARATSAPIVPRPKIRACCPPAGATGYRATRRGASVPPRRDIATRGDHQRDRQFCRRGRRIARACGHQDIPLSARSIIDRRRRSADQARSSRRFGSRSISAREKSPVPGSRRSSRPAASARQVDPNRLQARDSGPRHARPAVSSSPADRRCPDSHRESRSSCEPLRPRTRFMQSIKPVLPCQTRAGAFPSGRDPIAWRAMTDRTDKTTGSAAPVQPRLKTEDRSWQRTLWAMVGIQFVMTAAINFLSPIIPLMLPELGVRPTKGVYLGRHHHRRHLVRRRVRLAGLGPRRRPLRAQAFAAALELCHRAVHRADGTVHQCLAVLWRPGGHGRLRRILLRRHRPGRQPGAGAPPRLCPGLAGIGPIGRLAGRPGGRRRAGGPDRQLPHAVLLVCRHHLRRPGAGLGDRARGFHAGRPRRASSGSVWRGLRC